LITVAEAVNSFDLPKFYLAVTRVVEEQGGIIAVLWGCNDVKVRPTFDVVMVCLVLWYLSWL
jgi:hypothetical protein